MHKPADLNMTEEQQSQAIHLLKMAWCTVDYWNHNGDLSTQIKDFLHQYSKTNLL